MRRAGLYQALPHNRSISMNTTNTASSPSTEPEDRLTHRMDTTQWETPFLGTRVAALSRLDRQEALCAVMDLLEQIEEVAVRQVACLQDWRAGRNLDEVPAAPVALPQSPWVPRARSSVDAVLGCVRELPSVYDTAAWQWAENGKIFKVSDLSFNDAGEALCQCLAALKAVTAHSGAMSQLVSNFQRGVLEPAHYLDFRLDDTLELVELTTLEEYVELGKSMRNALGHMHAQLQREGVRVFVLNQNKSPMLALSVRPDYTVRHVVGFANRRPFPHELAALPAILGKTGATLAYDPMTNY